MREKVLSLKKKDFIMQTFRSGGPGGQNQNKRNTGVRFTHPPSGAVGESREHRTQGENKKTAFRRMAESPSFKLWVKRQHHEIISQVESSMAEENLKIEYRKNGQWE